MEKRLYKVLAAVPRTDGTGEWLMNVGRGADNRDASINLYLHALPTCIKGELKLQIRQLDAEDLRKREAYRARTARPEPATTGAGGVLASAASESSPC